MATRPVHRPSNATPAAVTDRQRLDRILGMLPAADAAWLAECLCPKRQRGMWRRAERNDAIRALATYYPATSGRELAVRVHRALNAAALGWSFKRDRPPPSDARAALAHRILILTDGRPVAPRTIRRILAGADGGPPIAAVAGPPAAGSFRG